MPDKQARLAQDSVKCEVFDAVVNVPPGIDRESSIPGDGDTPPVSKSRLVQRTVRWCASGVHCCDEAISLESRRLLGRECPLRENHHVFVVKCGLVEKGLHPTPGGPQLSVVEV